MERRGSTGLIQAIMEVLSELTSVGDGVRSCYRKDCATLTRRIKMLASLFEELKETGASLPVEAVSPFWAVHTTLLKARDLLQECRDGSQFVLILDRDQLSGRFRQVTADMSRALDGLPLDALDVSDEVHEQVDLARAQLKRAKGRRVTWQDENLFMSVNSLFKREAEGKSSPDYIALQNLAERLNLETEMSWRRELKALEGRKESSGSRSEEKCLDLMIDILKRIQPAVEEEQKKSSTGASKASKEESSSNCAKTHSAEVSPFAAPPEDFKCPISLELMHDPVIVATGQTYERSCIQHWLDTGNKTCPKTQQLLPHLVLTPNYVLRSLIQSWCESRGMEMPKTSNSGLSGANDGSGDSSAQSGEEALVGSLLLKLASDQTEVQRGAAGELRLLAKLSPENRLCIANSGAIPILVSLLSTPDLKTQEHAVTALLNLSIHEPNKRRIVVAGAIDPIVKVLKHGSMEARENSAAALFSLSTVDDHKVAIGASGAIPALVVLLNDGQSRGKKDAATALFQLSIYQANKIKAVRSGVVAPLLDLLLDTNSGMVDEALAILAVLTTHQEGRAAIGKANVIVQILVDLIKNGTPRIRENGAAVLLSLCSNSVTHASNARKLGAVDPLTVLLQSGTSRAKRKASELLQHLRSSEDSTTSAMFGRTGRTNARASRFR